ncbi:hypothetical protein N9318_04980 [Euryarchaeota archaeon]|nr:hypothetical protein [Euryarchaeota archaeon]
MERYLLDCVESLQSAGSDEVARKKAIQRPDGWELLHKNWKALAILVAEKIAPEVVDKKDLENNSKNRNISRRRRGSRRGGRQAKSGFDLLPPQQVIDSNETAAFKLAVLIAQKHKMNSWESSFDDQMNLLRVECSQGVHPVWSRLAREAPLFAELERFEIKEEENVLVDAKEWISASNIDPRNNSSLLKWLEMDMPFKLTPAQEISLGKIRKDLAGKPRNNSWPQIMKGKLRSLQEEAALLESILLLSANSDEAMNVLESIQGNKKLNKVVEKQMKLNIIRRNENEDLVESLTQEGDDELALAIRLESWRRIDTIDQQLSIELLEEGKILLEHYDEKIPSSLLWNISKILFDKEEYSEAITLIEGLTLNDSEEVIFTIKLISKIHSQKLENSILDAMKTSEEDAIVFAMRCENAPIPIQLEASKILSKLDSIRYTDEILSVLTRTADVEGLAESMVGDESLALVYPFRALMVWHLMPAESGINKIEQIINLRKKALVALEDSERDDVLSDVSISLISLLGGVSSDMESIHKILDSKSIVKLNEVRRALSAEGDGVVKNSLIESLSDFVINTEMTTLNKRLFSSLINSLYLNSAAMQLQSGNDDKRSAALLTLEQLAGKEDNTIRTIRALTNLVKEHSIGIESLEKWYRAHDKDSAEYQIIRAALEKEKGNRLNAARAYKEGALKVNDDYEESSLILRKAMIEYAHAGSWKEAVDLLDQNPELETLLTQRFQLYLRTCADNAAGNTASATKMLIHFVSEEEKIQGEEYDSDFNKRRKEALELIQKYPDEHNLPDKNFKGRVKAALLSLEKSGNSRQSDLERRFQLELHKMKDIYELTLLGEQIAEENPLRGIRRFEEAIETGYFKGREVDRLRDTQRAVFASQSANIPVKDRRILKNLGLKPLILVDTNILIHALKDDLLQEISNDDLGSFDWSVERSFHMMLRRQGGKETFLSIPPAALGEFKNRTKNPDVVLNLFHDVYIDRKEWKRKITSKFLKERVAKICESFSTWRQEKYSKERDNILLEEFLEKHEKIFDLVDEQKRRRSEEIPPRTEINGKDIYPERGDMDIMCDAALLASSPLQEIGSILVATRDSDFRLVSRALEEEYGFGVVSDAQQLNSRIR